MFLEHQWQWSWCSRNTNQAWFCKAWLSICKRPACQLSQHRTISLDHPSASKTWCRPCLFPLFYIFSPWGFPHHVVHFVRFGFGCSFHVTKKLWYNFWIFTERTQLRACYFKSLFLSTVTPSMAPKTGFVKMKEMVRRSEHPSTPLADVPWSSDWFMMGSYLDLISWLWVRSLQPHSTSTPFNDVDNIFWKEHIPKAPQTQTWKETVHSSKPLFDCFFSSVCLKHIPTK